MNEPLMRQLRRAGLALTLALSATAYAHGERLGDPLAELEPDRLMQGVIRESDVTLFLDYLRDAIQAAAEGREPAPPPKELERRAEQLGAELKSRSALAALLMLSALEEQAKALVRRNPPPPHHRPLPPTVPYTKVRE